MTWINVFNFAAAVSGLMAAILGFILTLSLNYIEQHRKRFFLALFALLIVYIIADLLTQLSFNFIGWENWRLSKTFMFLESLFSSMLMPLLTLYILDCAGESRQGNPAYYIPPFLWLVYLALLVITQFSECIYYITPDNVYHRGPLYPLLLVPAALLMLVNLIILYRHRDAITKRQMTALLTYLLIPLLCMIFQMFSFGLLMIVIGSSAAALCMFIFTLTEQMDRYVEQRERIASQEVSITVLQMRPHFIYNTLTSIYYLCKQDPDKAQQVTLDFTTYLRGNFNTIAKNGDIPFTKELEHTKAYLAVEQARFSDKLYVELDTPYTDFRIPPLTLQPIVENTIKHGLDPDLDPLRISIRTQNDPRGHIIIVDDTGPGFTEADSNKPHIALKNIIERLDLICGGTLTISPRPGGGTRVEIFIPHKKEL